MRRLPERAVLHIFPEQAGQDGEADTAGNHRRGVEKGGSAKFCQAELKSFAGYVFVVWRTSVDDWPLARITLHRKAIRVNLSFPQAVF